MTPANNAPDHPYDRHVGRYGKELAAGLIEVAEVGPGDRVLDVGCGPGQLTMEVARTVGEKNVAAIDVAEDVVRVCRQRVPGADIRVGSTEDLPFADAAFEAVLAQLVVNLVDDPPAAVREMARVARPGAAVAACFWDDDEMPLLRSYWDAARKVAPERFVDGDDQTQVGLSDIGLLTEWWRGAGLEDVALGEFTVSAAYESFDDLWFSFESGIGHSGALYVSLDSEQQKAVKAGACQLLRSPEGAFNLTAGVRTVRGTR